MSWNARQLARSVNRNRNLSQGDPRLVWVTKEALERAFAAVRLGTLEVLSIPFPAQPLVIGLGSAVHGGSETWCADIISIESIADIPAAISTEDNHPVGGLVQSGYEVVGWMHDGANLRSAILTSVYGGGIDCWAERKFPEINCYAPPALGGDEDMYHGERLGTATQVVAVVIWALLNEPSAQLDSAITVESSTVSTGKSRRRRESDVSVVDIKRPAGVRYTPSGRVIERDHRWEVDGHWKRQHYGKGNSLVKRIWIDEYVCGPADQPLVRKPKVGVLR